MPQSKGRPAKQKATKTASREVSFDYIKSPQYRTIHADGVHGGVSPRGYIQMAIWNQRHAIPTKTTHEVRDDGAIGDELRREGRDAIVREVDVTAIFDLQLAKAMVVWLVDKITRIEEIQQDQDSPEGEIP